MATTDVIILIVAAIFIMGAAVGVVVVVSIGIRHEELLFREERRHREEEHRCREAQSNWTGPDGPNQHFSAMSPSHFSAPPSYFSAMPPNRVCHGARALTGLWIRRERGADPLAVPWYERRHNEDGQVG